uniref:TNF receptor superfamily member 1B n=1 Tax=Sphenodon punctatus TaxID=8508 RepID=A0A8D0H841_SPHPU
MGLAWIFYAVLLVQVKVGAPLPDKGYSLPYAPQTPNQCSDPKTEFYEESIAKCCIRCPPGSCMLQRCNNSIDTQCKLCETDTFTEVWNMAASCLGCSSPCRNGFVETRKCTRTKDRICGCPSNKFCSSKIQNPCRLCKAYRVCGKGYGVSVQGTEIRNVVCASCQDGTFSDEESHTATCRPHRVCQSVSVPGNSKSDTVCSDPEAPAAVIATAPPITTPRENQLSTQSSTFRIPTVNTSAVQLPSPFFQNVAVAVGAIVLLLGLIIGATYFVICRKKEKCHHAPVGEANTLYLPTEKQLDKRHHDSNSPVQEEQHLLETSGSSSSSLASSTGSANTSGINSETDERKETERNQQRCPTSEDCRLGSVSSEHSGNGGTQVTVTCIVNVCNSDHNSKFPRQNVSASEDFGNTPHCTPTEGGVPLSKEENPLKKETNIVISEEAEESLLQNLAFPEGKQFPLSIQDMGMKAG